MNQTAGASNNVRCPPGKGHKLAQYQQRKARHNGQNPKKQKKKKISSLNINQQNDETSINSSQCVESAGNPDSTRMRTLPSGQIENHDQVFDELESKISTTADDSSSLEMCTPKANNKLVNILLEVAKTTAAAAETINCHILGILDRSIKGKPAASLLWRSEADLSAKPFVQDASGRVMDESVPSYSGSAIAGNDSKWPQVTEEGGELSQQFGTSAFAGSEMGPENFELMLNVRSQLQTAVEKLLEAISEASSQDLRFPLEDQKQRNPQLDALLGQQRQLLNELQQKIESQKMLYAQLAEEQGRNIELWALLESKKVRVQEMKDTLDKEWELHAQLQSSGDGGQPWPVVPPETLLQELQKQLEEKQKHRFELVNETPKYNLDSLRTKYQVEKDRQVHQKTLQMEKEANTLGQRKMEELQSKVEEPQHQLQEKRHQPYKLDLQGKRLQGIMQEFQKQKQEEKRGSRWLVYQNINKQATWNSTDDRTRNWVLQQKMEEEAKSTSYTKPIELNGGNIISNNNLELTRQKLQHVATKHQHGDQKACNSLEFEVSDEDVLTRVRERIDRIIFRLEKLSDQPDPDARPCFPPSSRSPPLHAPSTAPSSPSIPKCQLEILRNTFYLKTPETTPIRIPEEFPTRQHTE